MKKKFYISTAISYTSAKPHIGNTYEAILADAIARYKRLTGYDVYFQTGTDEHGLKIQEKAKEKGISPKEYVDNIANEIKQIWDVMNVSYDKFVRTTDSDHVKIVESIFEKLYKQGDIYKGEYEGWYCIPCESFFTDSELINHKCPDCGREVNLEKEEAYFFKLSKYQTRLENYIKEHTDFIQPESRKNEMIQNFIKPGLKDLCVSRTSFDWGIKVPFDKKHVIYVWIDALTNYITTLGYNPNGNSDGKFNKYWPCDLHLIGKDILRFHTIYWPIMLMALNIELPKKVFGHPWLLMNNDKMSKSKGNVMYADKLSEIFGIDVIRYYLLHEIPFSNDGNITYELIIDRTNSDLVNTLGNLVNRTIAMQWKYFNGKIYNPNKEEKIDKDLKNYIYNCVSEVDNFMEEIKVSNAIDKIFDIYNRGNKYIDEVMPWVLAKDENNKDRLATVLYNLLELIRIGTILLNAFLPNISNKIFSQLNTNEISYESIKDFNGMLKTDYVNKNIPIINRIDKEKLLKEIVDDEI